MVSTDPASEARDNRYLLTVNAASGTGDRARTAELEVTVTVADVDEPPFAPSRPTVTGTSTSTVLVEWTEPGNDGPPIDDYDYRYRTHAPRGSWTEVTDTTLTELTVTIAGLAGGTRYDVQVRASNAEGTGPWSESGTGQTDPGWNVAAWLARFGRTASDQVLAAVEDRFSGAGRAGHAGSQAAVAGRRLQAPAGSSSPEREAAPLAAESARFRVMEFRELLAGSSFNVAVPADGDGAGDGGNWAVWGRGAWSRFAGADDVTLEGDVISAILGADYARGPVIGGLALAYSAGHGSLRAGPRDSADIDATLLGVHPYLRLALHDQVALWGVLGYGLLGEAVLNPSDPARVAIDFRLLMGALGGSAVLLPAAPAGGFELTSKADGLLVAIRSDAAEGIAPADADVMRLRLLLEASLPQRTAPRRRDDPAVRGRRTLRRRRRRERLRAGARRRPGLRAACLGPQRDGERPRVAAAPGRRLPGVERRRLAEIRSRPAGAGIGGERVPCLGTCHDRPPRTVGAA